MQLVTIYYVRHGENQANLTREFSHRLVDYGLTDRGIDQAHRLAAFLAGCPPLGRPVFSSPLRRAVQTAEIVADRLATSVRVLEDLRELDVGELDGRADAEAWGRYDDVLAAWSLGRAGMSFPGGEDLHRAVARLRRALAQVTRDCTRDPAVVIGHGGLMRAAVATLCPGATPPAADMQNCAITELALRVDDEQPTGALVCWSQRPEFAALLPGTGRRRAVPPPRLESVPAPR